MSHEIKIIFPDKETKMVFATWMSDGGGEQNEFLQDDTIRVKRAPEEA